MENADSQTFSYKGSPRLIYAVLYMSLQRSENSREMCDYRWATHQQSPAGTYWPEHGLICLPLSLRGQQHRTHSSTDKVGKDVMKTRIICAGKTWT